MLKTSIGEYKLNITIQKLALRWIIYVVLGFETDTTFPMNPCKGRWIHWLYGLTSAFLTKVHETCLEQGKKINK